MGGKWKGYTIRKYKFIRKPGHPRASQTGYIPEQVLVMEKEIGRYLTDDEIVHHINSNPLDNRIENLYLCASKSEHHLIHAREIAFKECGNLSKRKCCYCHKYDFNENLKHNKVSRHSYHIECRRKYDNNSYKRKQIKESL